MSGGSFDYLGLVYDLDGLIQHRRQLGEMHELLAALPWATVAALETARVIAMLDIAESRASSLNALAEVWHDVEWWKSGDYSEQQAREACAAFEDLRSSIGGRS